MFFSVLLNLYETKSLNIALSFDNIWVDINFFGRRGVRLRKRFKCFEGAESPVTSLSILTPPRWRRPGLSLSSCQRWSVRRSQNTVRWTENYRFATSRIIVHSWEYKTTTINNYNNNNLWYIHRRMLYIIARRWPHTVLTSNDVRC